jgi:E3 ubiquitin-protein ligase HUWE1
LSSNTPVKPRSSVLNYLIYDLLCQGNLSGTTDSIAAKKKSATAAHTHKVLVALVSKTREKPFDPRTTPKFVYDDDSDLQFVRKFVLDTILKAYERTPTSDDPLETRYARMQSLAELMNHMVGERDREHGSHTRSSDSVQVRSQAQLRRMMYEKGYLEKLTSSIAEINLNYPGVKRAIKYILRVLRILTDTAKYLSQSNLLPSNPTDAADEDFMSSSSLSDLEDDREETPDLYRNSSLGMLEPGGGSHGDESDEDDEDGGDMYGDEYDDEMDYDEEGMSEDEQDNISEDSEMGEIEGLPGEPGVVEVVMDDDDDDDDDEDEDEDDDSDDDDDEDDDLDSADMEDVEDRVEIVNEDGDPVDDDQDSQWESESDEPDDEDLEADALDYGAEAQDAEEAHVHGMPPPVGLLNNMARALMEGDEYDPDLMDEHYPEDALDDEGLLSLYPSVPRAQADNRIEEEDEEDMEEQEYLYDDDYPRKFTDDLRLLTSSRTSLLTTPQ